MSPSPSSTAVILLLATLCTVTRTQTVSIDELPPPSHALTPDETCEYCQVALRTVYGHFGGKIVSRRKLTHQLKHECNRHYPYRRRCLVFVKDHCELIYQEMTGNDFKPIKPCFVMKECKRFQSPITEDFTIPPPVNQTDDVFVAVAVAAYNLDASVTSADSTTETTTAAAVEVAPIS